VCPTTHAIGIKTLYDVSDITRNETKEEEKGKEKKEECNW
jgi:hypothetical protein